MRLLLLLLALVFAFAGPVGAADGSASEQAHAEHEHFAALSAYCAADHAPAQHASGCSAAFALLTHTPIMCAPCTVARLRSRHHVAYRSPAFARLDRPPAI